MCVSKSHVIALKVDVVSARLPKTLVLLLDTIIMMTERVSRATNTLTEGYTVLLLLAWNNISTNGRKMSVPQQEEVMKVKASDWIKIISESYNHIPLKDDTREVLEAQITKDKGNAMIRKAKEAIKFIVNDGAEFLQHQRRWQPGRGRRAALSGFVKKKVTFTWHIKPYGISYHRC